ncbi:MAG: proline--tRNA ligase [Myxococcota bacterium]
MRMTRLLVPTVKETPSDAQVISHQLMIRAGLIRKVAAGVYNYLPLGLRSIRKFEAILREELTRSGCQEVLLPTVQPAELWVESGRWQQYGPELLRFKDRKGTDYCYAPTAEEAITALVRDEVKSYRDLPKNLFQIQTKFRDEIRPRFGLMRGREFTMKDGYSFDVDEAGALKTYDEMYDCYNRIFSRCGLKFRPVEADTGNIGGTRSHEFQVLAESGEDAIVACTSCNYAANVEKAEVKAIALEGHDKVQAPVEPRLTPTPGKQSCAEVAAFLGLHPSLTLKSVVYLVDDVLWMVLVPGHRETNEIKVKAAVKGSLIRPAEKEELARAGLVEGYMGPHALPDAVRGKVKILVDRTVAEAGPGERPWVTGGNQAEHHYTGVRYGTHFKGDVVADVLTAGGDDTCGRCGKGKFTAHRGIEVGHVFYLGTKYSAPLKCHHLDEKGVEKPMVMGCYGVGVGRTIAASIEQNHDADGIIWPMALAPYHCVVLPLGPEPELAETAEKIYTQLNALGVETVLDDRNERPGVKFKDADLIGFPIRISVGKKGLKDGNAELKLRASKDVKLVKVEEVAAQARKLVDEALGR